MPARTDRSAGIIEVRESSIRRAVKHMALNEKYIVEGAGAAAVAAVTDYPEWSGPQLVFLPAQRTPAC